MPRGTITLSVVSHRQNGLVNDLLHDLRRHCAADIALVVTQNVPDPIALSVGGTEVISNTRVKGFGANHNAAFVRCATPYFCVVNPDIRLPADPFPALLESLQRPNAVAAGPLVRSPAGAIEDSARRFPTPATLLRKLVSDQRRPDYAVDQGPITVDWVAGMFMLFRTDAFRQAGGFDERYFLYYEDVDLCRRIRAAGGRVLFQPRAEVIHDARRASRRNPVLAWHHARSALRFLLRR